MAIRVPAHAGISLMLEEIEMDFSTSTNLAGQSVPLKIEDMSAEIAQEAAFFIIDKQPRAEQLPSTIIRYDKYTNEKPITIVREGAISRKLLASVSEELQYLLKDE